MRFNILALICLQLNLVRYKRKSAESNLISGVRERVGDLLRNVNGKTSTKAPASRLLSKGHCRKHMLILLSTRYNCDFVRECLTATASKPFCNGIKDA